MTYAYPLLSYEGLLDGTKQHGNPTKAHVEATGATVGAALGRAIDAGRVVVAAGGVTDPTGQTIGAT